MSKSRGSPRKFSEKIALLNRKEAETNAEFEKIIKEVEETTRASPSLQYPSRASSSSSWTDDQRHIDNQLPNLEQFTQYNDNVIVHDGSSLHVQQHLASPSQTSSNYDQMCIQTPAGVPNIEIFPTNDDSYQQQQQLVSNTNYRNDCSNPISASRSLPDIANLRVSGSYSSMAPSYSDQRIPSDNYNNYNHNHYNNTNSNIVNNRDAHYSHENNQPQATLDTITCWQIPPADGGYTYLEHGSSSWCGSNNETLSVGNMMQRSNSYNNIGNFNDQSDSKAQLYYPEQQVYDPSPSQQRQEDSRDLVI